MIAIAIIYIILLTKIMKNILDLSNLHIILIKLLLNFIDFYLDYVLEIYYKMCFIYDNKIPLFIKVV